MSNGPDDKAFDAMNSIIGENENIIPEGGEVSAWFPSGKFLGMDVPEGTSGIIEGLVFLAAGNPSPTVAKALTNKIRNKVDWEYMPQKLQEKVLGTAKEQLNYMERVDKVVNKLNVAGEKGKAAAQKVFETAVKNAPPGLAKDKALADISKNKAVFDFARKHGQRLSKIDKRLPGPTDMVVGRRAIDMSKELSKYRKELSSLAEAASEKVSSPSRLRRFLEDFKYEQALVASKERGTISPLLKPSGRFSIPYILDEIEK